VFSDARVADAAGAGGAVLRPDAAPGPGPDAASTTADAMAGAMAQPGQEGRFLGLYQTFVSAAIGGGPAMLWLTGVQAGAFAGCAALMGLGFLLTLRLREVVGAVPRRMRMSIPRLRPVALMMLAPAGAALLCGALESTAGAVFPVQGLAMGLGATAAA
jgi:hypothetical protein